LGLNNFEALKINNSRNHLLKLFTTNFTYTQSLPSSSPMSQKTLNKRNSCEKVKVLGIMCKIIGISKIIPHHKKLCLQRGANGKNVNHVLMK
jgi:hypothetical protein